MKPGRVLDTGYKPQERDYKLFGHSLIVSQVEEFQRLARIHLRRDGIVMTKNNTILRIIK